MTTFDYPAPKGPKQPKAPKQPFGKGAPLVAGMKAKKHTGPHFQLHGNDSPPADKGGT